MKKIYTTFVALFALTQFSYGQTQWTTSGTGIYNTNAGNVGIGTTNPQTKLHIVGGEIRLAGLGTSGIPSASVLSFYDSNNVTRYGYIGDASAGNSDIYLTADIGALHFGTNGANDRLFINTLGNVGIGTTTPATPLDVNGRIQTNTGILFNNGKAWDISLNSANIFFNETGTATRFTILAGGNIGIGTTNPTVPLHIMQSAVANTDIPMQKWDPSTTGYGLTLSNYNGIHGIDYRFTQLTNGTSTQVLMFQGGNVGINTPDTHGYRFAVNGEAIATSMTVKLYANWPDYVFKKDYTLPSLAEVKTYIEQNHHLSEMPSEQQVAKDGINLGEMVKLQTKKIEELTLYLIEKDKQLTEQQEKSKQQDERIAALEKALSKLTNSK
jgi:hypothetical protein